MLLTDVVPLDHQDGWLCDHCLPCRRQGQPLLAACAALTISDITAAVTALHLGNEPEQAAMLALALGQLGSVNQQLLDRVYAALAIKCEAAGESKQSCPTCMAPRLVITLE